MFSPSIDYCLLSVYYEAATVRYLYNNRFYDPPENLSWPIEEDLWAYIFIR